MASAVLTGSVAPQLNLAHDFKLCSLWCKVCHFICKYITKYRLLFLACDPLQLPVLWGLVLLMEILQQRYKPFGPAGPVTPMVPGRPDDPVEPGTPGAPVNPVNPVSPSIPTLPVAPVKPVAPVRSGKINEKTISH